MTPPITKLLTTALGILALLGAFIVPVSPTVRDALVGLGMLLVGAMQIRRPGDVIAAPSEQPDRRDM